MADSDHSLGIQEEKSTVLQGYLRKAPRGTSLHKNKVRFFVLSHNGMLQFFTDSLQHELRGQIPVSTLTSITIAGNNLTLTSKLTELKLSECDVVSKAGAHSLEEWHHAITELKAKLSKSGLSAHESTFASDSDREAPNPPGKWDLGAVPPVPTMKDPTPQNGSRVVGSGLATDKLLIWLDASSAHSGFKHDMPVISWPNLAPGGGEAEVQGEGRAPVADEIGGGNKPCVMFTGQQWVECRLPDTNNSPATIFAVVWASNLASTSAPVLLSSDTPLLAIADTQRAKDSTASLYTETNPASDTTIHVNGNPGQSQPMDNRKWHLVTYVQREGALGGKLCVGGANGYPPFIGAIAEVIVYGRLMRDDERESVEHRLQTKWLSTHRMTVPPHRLPARSSSSSLAPAPTPITTSGYVSCVVGVPYLWQSFVADNTGALNGILVRYLSSSPVEFKLYRGSGTTGALLSVQTLPACDVWGDSTVPITGVNVVEGDELTFQFAGSGCQVASVERDGQGKAGCQALTESLAPGPDKAVSWYDVYFAAKITAA